jgi:hypothetical protein
MRPGARWRAKRAGSGLWGRLIDSPVLVVALTLTLVPSVALVGLGARATAGGPRSSGAVPAAYTCGESCGGGGGGCGLTYTMTLKVAGGEGRIFLSGYNGTGGPALDGVYANGQKLTLCIGANYGITPEVGCGYAFSKWTETNLRLFQESGLELFTNVSKLQSGASAVLTLKLVASSAWAHLTVYVTSAEGSVAITNPSNGTAYELTNDSTVCLPEETTLTLEAHPATGWAFVQWYVPDASLGAGYLATSPSTSMVFSSSPPNSLALIESAPPVLATPKSVQAFPWTGYSAPYPDLEAVSGEITVPSVAFNASVESGDELQELTEAVGLGAYAGPGSTAIQLGIGQMFNASDPSQEISYAFVSEYANYTELGYLLEYCWLPSSLFHNDVPDQFPAGCPANSYGELPGSLAEGSTVAANVSFGPPPSGDCAKGVTDLLAVSLKDSAWDGPLSQDWCEAAINPYGDLVELYPPSPSVADWEVSVPTVQAWGPDGVFEAPDAPNVSAAPAFSSEAARWGSPAQWTQLAAGSPVVRDAGGWTNWYGNVGWVAYLPSGIGPNGDFTAPSHTGAVCLDCVNYSPYRTFGAPYSDPVEYPPTELTTLPGTCSAVQWTGDTVAGTDGSTDVLANLTPIIGNCGVTIFGTAGFSLGAFYPSVTGTYEFVFNWSVSWQASVQSSADVGSDPDNPSAGFAGGNVSLGALVGGWNITGTSETSLGRYSETFASEGNSYDPFVFGSWSGTAQPTIAFTARMVAGDAYVVYSQLWGYGKAVASQIFSNAAGGFGFALHSYSGSGSQLLGASVFVNPIPTVPGS